MTNPPVPTNPPIPIYRGQDFYVPAFEVKVGEKRLERDVIHDITQVTYKDNVKEIDSFEITINNWDSATRTFKYSDADTVPSGQEGRAMDGLLRQQQAAADADRRDHVAASDRSRRAASRRWWSAASTCCIDCASKQESHAYDKRTDSQIAKEIQGRLNIQIETD